MPTDNRLLSDDEIRSVTGRVRYSKQVEWFRQAFGVDLPCSTGGRPVISWTVFESLQSKRLGLIQSATLPARPALRAVGSK